MTAAVRAASWSYSQALGEGLTYTDRTPTRLSRLCGPIARAHQHLYPGSVVFVAHLFRYQLAQRPGNAGLAQVGVLLLVLFQLFVLFHSCQKAHFGDPLPR
jgi:hypothetical protein